VAFSYDLATSVGRLRLILTDTRQETAWFADEELTYLLGAAGGDLYGAAYEATNILLMDGARRAQSYTNEQGSVDETAALATLQAMRDDFKARAVSLLPTVLVTELAPFPSDPNSTV